MSNLNFKGELVRSRGSTSSFPIPHSAVFLENLPDPRPIMVTRQELPKLFPGMTARTWANLAHEKKGPRFYRIGKLAWYVVDDVIEYLTQNPIHTTLTNR